LANSGDVRDSAVIKTMADDVEEVFWRSLRERRECEIVIRAQASRTAALVPKAGTMKIFSRIVRSGEKSLAQPSFAASDAERDKENIPRYGTRDI
jgi:hypothetical protein